MFIQAPEKEWDPATDPLPPQLITSLLQPKYRERMIRLGIIPPDPPQQDTDAQRLGSSQGNGGMLEGDDEKNNGASVGMNHGSYVDGDSVTGRMGEVGSTSGPTSSGMTSINDLKSSPSKSKLRA